MSDYDDTKNISPFIQALGPFQTYEFADGSQVPDEFTAGAGSSLAICPDLFWRGSGSLKWQWSEPCATICYRHEDVFRNLTGNNAPDILYQWIIGCRLSTLSFNLFNPQAVNDVLWVEIGDGVQVDSRFYISLNFTGWRMVRIWYGRDMPGFPDPQRATTLKIIAPKSLRQGTLYIDQFSPRREEEVRGLSFDAQLQPNQAVPWVNNPDLKGDESDLVDGKPPLAPYLPRPHGYHDYRERNSIMAKRPRRTIETTDELSIEQKRIIADLTRRFQDSSIPPAVLSDGVCDAKLKELLAIRQTKNIRRYGNIVSGNIDSKTHFLGDEVSLPGKFWQDIYRVGLAWHSAVKQPQAREQLCDLLRDMAGLVITQGHNATYSLGTSFVEPLFNLKSFWQEQGVFAPLLSRLRDILNIDDFYDPQAYADADVFHTDLESRMAVVLAAEDTPDKWRDLEAIKQWFDRISRFGAVKSDGSFHHHWSPNPGYTVPALPLLVKWLHFFHDTPFASELMHAAVRRVAYTFHFFSNSIDIPTILGGRWRQPYQISFDFADLYRKLALMGHPDSPGQGIDREMAGAYLFYADHYGRKDDDAAIEFSAQGIKPWKPTGHLTLNQSASAVHRRDNWMAFLRGHKHELMGMEAYGIQNANVLGRYINYGSLQLISAGNPPNPKDSGWPGDDLGILGGWDANFWPGTTSRVLPYESLRSPFLVEEHATEETFAIGTNLLGNGVYGLKLREQYPDTADDRRIGPHRYWLGEEEYWQRIKKAKYDPGFRARKSWFFFDDMVVALGSGIESRDQQPVVTTLFQHTLTEEELESGSFITGDNQKGFPFDLQCDLNAPRWLIDKNGNGCYLPKQEAQLRIKRQYADHSIDVFQSKGPTELAWLIHGRSVRRYGYEYALLMRSDIEHICDFSRRMQQQDCIAPYQLLQHDELAHIVYYPAGNVTGYVVFDSRHLLAGKWLRSISRPAAVMVYEKDNDQLEVSVVDPEFGEDMEYPRMWSRGPMKPTNLYVEIKGAWQTDCPDAQAFGLDKAAATLFKVTCKEGLPVKFKCKLY